MSSTSTAREYHVIDSSKFRQLKSNTNTCTSATQTNYMDSIFTSLQSNLLPRARDLMSKVAETERFQYILTTAEIVIDCQLIINSNLLDLLNYILSDGTDTSLNLIGLNQFIMLITSTSIPSYYIQNKHARNLYLNLKESKIIRTQITQ